MLGSHADGIENITVIIKTLNTEVQRNQKFYEYIIA